MGAKKYYLSQSTTNAGRKKAKGLHIAIWEEATGKTVPTGHHVHHKDGNQLNNHPDNLACITAKENLSLPKQGDRPKQKAHLAKARQSQAFKDWHAATRGSEWRKKIQRMAMEARRANPHHKVCQVCGTPYDTIEKRSKYCSKQCQWKASGRRRRIRKNRRRLGDAAV